MTTIQVFGNGDGGQFETKIRGLELANEALTHKLGQIEWELQQSDGQLRQAVDALQEVVRIVDDCAIPIRPELRAKILAVFARPATLPAPPDDDDDPVAPAGEFAIGAALRASFPAVEPGSNPRCEKCGGAGWLWWKELDNYDGPAVGTGQDDTRYPCDRCSPVDEDEPSVGDEVVP